MQGFWQSPEVQGGVVPFVIAFVLVALIRFGGGRGLGARLAILGVGIGFLAAYYLLESITWPAVSSKQKVFFIAAAFLVAGLFFDLVRLPAKVGAVIGLVGFIAALYWLTERNLARGPDTTLILQLAGLAIAAAVVFFSLAAITPSDAWDETGNTGPLQAGSVMLLVAFAGGAVSFFGAFIGMAQLLIALGAVFGAWMLLHYLGWAAAGAPMGFGNLGTVGTGGVWLTCVAVMILFAGSVNPYATALLLLSFILGVLARPLAIGGPARGRLLSPILYGIVVALPAAAAVAWVILTAEPDTGY